MVGSYDAATQQWTTADTGVSPATVYGAISAAYYGGTEMMVWRSWDSSIKYVTRSTWLGSSWGSVQTVAGATSNQDVALVSGTTGFRIFFRDTTSGRLRYVEYNGSAFGSPVVPPVGYNLAFDSAVSATSDGSKLHVAFLLSNRATVVQTNPSTNEWDGFDTFSMCAFDTSATKHEWSATPAIVTAGTSSLHMLGPVEDHSGVIWMEQGYAIRTPPAVPWSYEAHGYIESYGDLADLETHDGRIWAVSWKEDIMNNTAAVFWKQQ